MMKINIAGVEFKNPVTTASGTFGSGREYGEFIDLNCLGAITVKGVSYKPWNGNDTPRIAEVYGGMLNSIGLQNLGVDYFIENDLPYLKNFDTKIIVNICGHTIEEYCIVAEALENTAVDLLELNISCPNIQDGGMAFGTDHTMTEKVVSAVRKSTSKPLIVKLSPNVSNIAEIAKAAESGGADGLSLINTLLGMKIDIRKKAAVLHNKMGGLSGPAIKPVAVRMVHQVSKAVSLPIIGMGGIMNVEDAIEFIMAGATGVAVGTANFANPYACQEIVSGIEKFMIDNNIKDLAEIRGIVE